jgi:predicted O-methyltransferase YrrM
VFIDANKESYPDYLAWAVDSLRPGGAVTAHNIYRHGAILAPQTDEDRIMDAFNHSLASHPSLDSMIIPLGDGLAVGIKK